MTDQPPELQVNRILDRRKQLKQQRQRKQLTSIWRTMATIGIATGLAWAMLHPDWKIRRSEQIEIVGNERLSPQALAELLPLSYPISLIRLDPQRITRALQTHAHLNRVVVSRRLFPPGIKIAVQERPPVAMTVCDRCLFITDPTSPDSLRIGPANVWLLDAQGIALPIHAYRNLEKSQADLPVLTLEHYFSPLPQEAPDALRKAASQNNATPIVLKAETQRHWQQTYATLQRSNTLEPSSPVHLSRLNWQDPNNLIARTKLGTIHLGPPSDDLDDQLEALQKLRNLSQQVELKDIVYIDLRTPQQPVLKKRQPLQPAPLPPP